MVCDNNNCVMKAKDGDILYEGNLKIATCPACSTKYTFMTNLGVMILISKETI